MRERRKNSDIELDVHRGTGTDTERPDGCRSTCVGSTRTLYADCLEAADSLAEEGSGSEMPELPMTPVAAEPRRSVRGGGG